MFWFKNKVTSDDICRVLILDRSSSMSDHDIAPDRLEAAKKAAAGYLDRVGELSPESKFSVIAYCNYPTVMCRNLAVSDNYDQILRSIEGIKSGGSTDIGNALEKAEPLFKEGCFKSGQIVLLTDGMHNGAVDPVKVARTLKKRSVRIDCVGVGGDPRNVDEALMKRIASREQEGVPCYHYIKDGFELVKHFKSLAGYLSRE